ncbi:hypothetical protein HMPREF9075_00063 [Capnocytophaga sp. oral taxon 332 str. F0381]|nr:hypothetical protein HMPREF9075_00063 [Capnocytophaga sp. oral taxon 332 str. F0381]
MKNTNKTYMYSAYTPRPTFIRRNNNNKLHTEKGDSQGIYNPNDTLQDYITVGLVMFSVPLLIIILGAIYNFFVQNEK